MNESMVKSAGPFREDQPEGQLLCHRWLNEALLRMFQRQRSTTAKEVGEYEFWWFIP